MKNRMLMTAASIIAIGLAGPVLGASNGMKSDAEIQSDTNMKSPAPAGSDTRMKGDMKPGSGPAGSAGKSGAAAGGAHTAASAAQPQASDVLGKDVVASNGKDIGDVQAVITDDQGKIRGIALDVGGFLGLGARTVALGWDDVTVAEKDKIRVNMSDKELEKLPEYKITGENKKKGVFVDTAHQF